MKEDREQRKDTRQTKNSNKAKQLAPGTYVSVRAQYATKGRSPWQTGFQILSSYQGGLRVLNLATGRVLRVHQDRVRELPDSKPYDEIDPLKKKPKDLEELPQTASPIQLAPNPYLPIHVPGAAAASQSTMFQTEWEAWLDQVRATMRQN